MVKRDLIRNIIIAVLAIVVILLLRAFVFSTHRVTENQANDYIHAGDYVTFNKNVEPQKKDFILYTVNGKDYIGRVIADEGKSVTAMDDFLYVNDKSVDEAYISKDKSAYLATVSPGNFFTDDCFFLTTLISHSNQYIIFMILTTIIIPECCRSQLSSTINLIIDSLIIHINVIKSISIGKCLITAF